MAKAAVNKMKNELVAHLSKNRVRLSDSTLKVLTTFVSQKLSAKASVNKLSAKTAVNRMGAKQAVNRVSGKVATNKMSGKVGVNKSKK